MRASTQPQVLFSDEAAAHLFPRRSYSDDLARMDAAATALRAAVQSLESPGVAHLAVNGTAVMVSATESGAYIVETWGEYWGEPPVDDVNYAEQPEDFLP